MCAVAIGTGRLHRIVPLIVALMPVPAMAAVATDQLSPAHDVMSEAAVPIAQSAVPKTGVAPVSATASAATPVAGESDFVAIVPDKVPRRRWGRTVFAGLSIAELVAIGGVLIGVVIFARRRHRRRVAWGVIPDRPPMWRRLDD